MSTRLPEVLSPSAAATVVGTSSAAPTAARSANRTPSPKPGPSRLAASTASLVFPTPPGPVRVTSRTPSLSTRSATALASWSRPISGVAGTGSAPASGAWSGTRSGDAISNRSLSSTARSFSTRRCSSAASAKG